MTKQSIFVEYILEFCWSSLADEHNTLPKSTRRNVKLNKFAFETQQLYQIYYVNIDLYHHRASDISHGRGPAKFRYFCEIPRNSPKNALYR